MVEKIIEKNQKDQVKKKKVIQVKENQDENISGRTKQSRLQVVRKYEQFWK